VVNRVSPIGIAAGVLEVLLEHRPYRRRVHAAQGSQVTPCSAREITERTIRPGPAGAADDAPR
jgi:hypothetical protein